LGWYGQVVTVRHQRFALFDVTFAGVALPGATIGCWEDARGQPQWVARVLTRLGPMAENGELTGRTADGRILSGMALVADQQVGSGSRRETLVIFHGSGTLNGL
jgi:hypothetical protein